VPPVRKEGWGEEEVSVVAGVGVEGWASEWRISWRSLSWLWVGRGCVRSTSVLGDDGGSREGDAG
jgi:hypothetical protein